MSTAHRMGKSRLEMAARRRQFEFVTLFFTIAVAGTVLLSCMMRRDDSGAPTTPPPAMPKPINTPVAPAPEPAADRQAPSVEATWREPSDSAPSITTIKHVFAYEPDPVMENVRSVAVAGSFNGWSKDAHPLTKQDDGTWRASVTLPEGVHHYKFVVNGEHWTNDPASDKELEVDDNYGGKNSAVLIGPDARKLDPPAENAINVKGIRHDPGSVEDVNVVDAKALRVRVRAQAEDVNGAWLIVEQKTSPTTFSTASHRMYKGSTNLGYDSFSTVVQVAAPEIKYWITLKDGPAVVDVGRSSRSRKDDSDTSKSMAVTVSMSPSFTTPDWAKHAVWYQIFPERWRNGDPSNDPPKTQRWTSNWWSTLPGEAPGEENFYKGKGNVWQRRYGGDLQGLIWSLPYLRELGINAIYLNPIFEAESMHKYDTSDYRHVDQHFGTKGDITKLTGETDDPSTWKWTETDKLFLKFVEEAHRQGFKVVIDGVFNHVGRDHPFFQDVLKNGKKSRYADWFDVRDWNPPIKYMAWDRFGEPSTDGALPNFKKSDKTGLAEGPRQHIFAITRRWLAPNGDSSKGVDGFRLDVPGDIPHAFWIDWRKLVKGINPDAYISGEIWTWAQPWLQGDQFDAVMNYRFMEAGMQYFVNQSKAISTTEFNNRCFEIINNYPYQVSLVQMNLFDSHDTDRFASMFVNPDLPFDAANRLQDNGPNYRRDKPNETQWARMKQAVTWQMTFVGAPMIYYGDEVGMWSPDDPSNRQPMIWRDLQPYDDAEVTFKADLFEHYQRLIALRNQTPALRLGSFRPVKIDDGRGLYAYARDLSGQTVYVVLNKSSVQQTIELPVEADGTYIDWLSPAQASIAKADRPELKLDAITRGIIAERRTLTLKLEPFGSAVLSEKK